MPSNKSTKAKSRYEKSMKKKDEKQRKTEGKKAFQNSAANSFKENCSKHIDEPSKIPSFFITLSQDSEIKETISLDLSTWNKLGRLESCDQETEGINKGKVKSKYIDFTVITEKMRFIIFKFREGVHFNRIIFNEENPFDGIAHFKLTGDIPRTYKKTPNNYIKALVEHIRKNSLEDITNCEIVYRHEKQEGGFLNNFSAHFKIIETIKGLPYQLEESSLCKFPVQNKETCKNLEKSLPSTEDSETENSESEKESKDKSAHIETIDKEACQNPASQHDYTLEINKQSEWAKPIAKGNRQNKKRNNQTTTIIYTNNKKFKSKDSSEFVVSGKRSPLGLVNIGNTCYMNSSLQSIFHTPGLSKWFCDEKNKENFKDGGLAHRLTALWELNKVVKNSGSLKEEISSFKKTITTLNPDFDDEMQHDAFELYKTLLAGLSEELNTSKGNNLYRMLSFNYEISDEENAEEYFNYMRQRETSIITSTFGGQILNIIRCKACGKEKKTCDEYWSLPLCFKFQQQAVISEPENTTISRKKAKKMKNQRQNKYNKIKETVKIEDMLKYFTDDEDLQAKISCDVCESDTDHTTASKILRLPNILVIAIKRFRHTNQGIIKENSCISFPTKELDLKEFTQRSHESLNDTKYELFGIINHTGTLDSGHYIAWNRECVDQKDKCWYRFDDANVKRMGDKATRPNPSESSAAYMLFYAKSSCLKE